MLGIRSRPNMWQCIIHCFYGAFVCPSSGAGATGLDNTSDAFVRKRMGALAVFLNRVLARDDLVDAPALEVFFAAPFDDFNKLSAAYDAAEVRE